MRLFFSHKFNDVYLHFTHSVYLSHTEKDSQQKPVTGFTNGTLK